MANVEGKATAITVVTPVRHGGRFLLALVFFAGRHVTSTLEKLQQLSFIHYARWAVIRRFPDGGSGEKFIDGGGTDPSGGPGDENVHGTVSLRLRQGRSG